MRQQVTSTNLELAVKKKGTCCEVFLAEIEQTIPWEQLKAVIGPVNPKPGNVAVPIHCPLVMHLRPAAVGLLIRWK
ncbi:hypothetical protein [Chromobacterium haemolyticum]|uniref:hypothetical protein n=1 Tax=Chromobacterium haemolyticum TaxID=394935 RepID=UPI0009D920F6|nr:hypothetical protein [Chromobacterium haemolyticum]